MKLIIKSGLLCLVLVCLLSQEQSFTSVENTKLRGKDRPTDSRVKGKITTRSAYSESPVLFELPIPSETTAEQMDEINRARAYAESLGIDLEVTIIE